MRRIFPQVTVTRYILSLSLVYRHKSQLLFRFFEHRRQSLSQAASPHITGLTMNNSNYPNDTSRYYLRSRSLCAQPEIEGDIPESSISSESPPYPYRYASSTSNQGGSSPSGTPEDPLFLPGPALIEVPFGKLALPPPLINTQPLSRRFLSTSTSHESTSDELLPQADRFSAQRIVQSLQTTPSQGFPYIESSADSTNYFQSYLPHKNNDKTLFSLPLTRTSPVLHSPNTLASLYHDHDNGLPPMGIRTDARPRNDYQGRPLIPPTNWSSPPSSPDSSQNEASVITQDMSAVPGNLSSQFSGQNEVPPSSITLTFPSRCPRCPNPDFMYPDVNLWLLHYWTEHPPATGSSHAWRPGECMLEGCNLRKSFRTHKSWLEHAHSVHYRRFWCTFDNCDVRKPFGSKNTLDRHLNTRHTDPIPCTITGCQAKEGINLWRKDKRTKHEAKYHGSKICTVAGCPRGRQDHGFSEQADLDKHMQVKHRYLPFETAAPKRGPSTT